MYRTNQKTLEDRFKQHLSYVANNTQATAQHFNQPSHNSSHMTISVLEKVHQIDRAHREDRESHWIMRFNLKYKGMNKKRWYSWLIAIKKFFNNYDKVTLTYFITFWYFFVIFMHILCHQNHCLSACRTCYLKSKYITDWVRFYV